VIALVGSGEFLAAMEDVDRGLLKDRRPRAVILPTAAGPEGDAVVDHWIELGVSHFTRLGAEAIAARVVSRDDADDDRFAALIDDAGLVYFSGGNPGYLADTLRESVVWDAVVRAWRGGAAIAGCSAGACALTAVAPDVRDLASRPERGLCLVPHLAVIPHFDRYESWSPRFVDRVRENAGEGVTVLGIDEDTALVGGPEHWRVDGRSTVTILAPNGRRLVHHPGDEIDIGPA
jgi:cyanophycinase